MVDIRTASGDGGVRIGVDAFGSFGSSASGTGTSDAYYDPLGSEGEAGTVYESYIALGLAGEETRTFLTSSGVEANIDTSDETTVASSFTIGNLSFQLNQSVRDLNENDTRIGSILTQEYIVTNTGTETADFELVRYIDGDLDFDGSIQDTGGRRIREGEEILFETDNGEDPSFATTFLGITAVGGSQDSPGRFEIDSFSGLRNRIAAGTELDEEITGDNIGNDGFVESAYDITLALRNGFSLEAGESETYTTETIFGTGTPGTVDISRSSGGSNFVGVPEEELVQLDTPVYRFHNEEVPGTYLYTGEEERAYVLENHQNFREEGYAFKVADDNGIGGVPIYRFHNEEVPGTYNYVGIDEAALILRYYSDTFKLDSAENPRNLNELRDIQPAFYVAEYGSGLGMGMSRFQNSQNPGTYLFAGGGERDHIRAAYHGFIEEGYAFEVGE